ncbi:AraC family transcriptional regulator [Paenibacillus sp. P26]|nr:AraC family transcriptional regulator [Paenibacillus sp. P26]
MNNSAGNPEAGCGCPQIRVCGDFTVKAGWTLGPRTIKDYELVYFPAGSETEYRVAGRVHVLSEPCFVLTRPGEEHLYAFDSRMPVRHLFVHFTAEPPVVNCNLSSFTASAIPSVTPVGPASVLPSLLGHLLHLAAGRPARREQRCSLMLLTPLNELEAHEDSGHPAVPGPPLPPQIVRALHYIESRLHLPLTVAEVARREGWTHEHFTRMFVQSLGISPQRAIAVRRIERACQLLAQTEFTIKQIAHSVGFKDEHYFSRRFSQIKGVPATKYRRQFSDPRLQHLAPVQEYTAAYPLNRYLVFP